MATEGLTRAGTRRLQAVSDRIHSAAARDQRRHRDVPADSGVLWAGARPRPASARAARCGDARRRERCRAADARRRSRRGRRRRTISAMMHRRRRCSSTSISRSSIRAPRFRARAIERSARATAWTVDPPRFPVAVNSASHILDREQDAVYNPQIFIDYTAHIIRAMGGRRCRGRDVRGGDLPGVGAVPALSPLRRCAGGAARRSPHADILIGLISNSHRCLESFQEHFELDGLIDVAVSSSQHGYMKPHPSIFEAALKLAGVLGR